MTKPFERNNPMPGQFVGTCEYIVSLLKPVMKVKGGAGAAAAAGGAAAGGGAGGEGGGKKKEKKVGLDTTFRSRYFAVETPVDDSSRYSPCNQPDTREWQPKHGSVDDSQYVPCNQSDTPRECQPYAKEKPAKTPQPPQGDEDPFVKARLTVAKVGLYKLNSVDP
jgi:hypothetical protein